MWLGWRTSPSNGRLVCSQKWPDQATYPNLLEVLAGVTLADSWDFPNLRFSKHCIFSVQNNSAHGGCRLMSNHLFKIFISNGYHCQFDGTQNHQGGNPLDMSVRKFLGQASWGSKTHSNCVQHHSMSRGPGWNRKVQAEPWHLSSLLPNHWCNVTLSTAPSSCFCALLALMDSTLQTMNQNKTFLPEIVFVMHFVTRRKIINILPVTFQVQGKRYPSGT